MKTITANNKVKDNSLYTTRFQMAFCSPPIKGKIHQIHHLISCKDYMNEVARDLIAERSTTVSGHGCSLTKTNRELFDKERVRFVITSGFMSDPKTKVKTGLMNSKRVLNYYEKLYKFSTQTRIFTAKFDYRTTDAWLVIGPKEWLASPHLLSLYITIIRSCVTSGTTLPKGLNEEQLLLFFSKVVTSATVLQSSQLSTTYRHISTVLSNKDNLFGHFDTLKEAWNHQSLIHANGGYYYLCTTATSYSPKVTEAAKKVFNVKS